VLRRAVTSTPVRAAVTIALLAALAFWIDWSRFANRVEHGRWDLFAAGVAVVAVALAVAGARWHIFLLAAGVRTGFLRALRAYEIGMFANNFLPTGFGGDVARAWIVGTAAGARTRAAVSVVVDRLSALACLVVLGWIAFAISGDVPAALVAALAAVSILGALVGGMLFVGPRVGGRARAETRRSRWFHSETSRAFRASLEDTAVLARTTALGLGYQAGIVFATWLLARAIRLDVSFAVLAVVTPVVLIATVIPISIAGFGVREAGYAALLGKAGVSVADATLLSLLNVAALAIATLPGAVALLAPNRGAPPTASEREP
jgi:uncharacterized protein (TIRG00374 family)